jgi:hypothetical protein
MNDTGVYVHGLHAADTGWFTSIPRINNYK